MDYSAIMNELETWLWSSPYLDVPNYAWMAAGSSLLVLLIYIVMLLALPGEEAEIAPRVEEPLPPAPEKDEIPPSKTEQEMPLPEKPEEELPSPEPEEAELPPHKPAETELPAPKPEEAELPLPKPEEIELVPPEGWLPRLRDGLGKTKDKLTRELAGILSRGKVDDEMLEELEEALITSDLGVKTSQDLLQRLEEAMKSERLETPDQVREWLKKEMLSILERVEEPLVVPPDHAGPFVIMVTGVNGTGKTTTIGKLAMRFRQEGRSVLLGAADTFRAAAIEQLEIWGERAGSKVIKHREGADPSAVMFDTIKAAQARDVDVVIADTAGRLHTKKNLMDELVKAKRITARELAGAPHEVLLALDATTGQNALQQAKTFHQALDVTGLVLTKLDGTAKGGIIVAVSDEFEIPIRFIGVGERIYDLQPFKAGEFVEALF